MSILQKKVLINMEQLAKNQIHSAVITGYTSEGAGVCRIGGRAVFVPGALEGEKCRVRILKVTGSAVYGRLEELISASPERIEPDCPVYGRCGGCGLLHMSYNEEKRFKLARVNDAILRIGGLDLHIDEIIAAEGRQSYRNKTIYNVSAGPVSGFFRRRTHEVIAIDRCGIQPACFDRAAAAVRSWMARENIPAYDEKTGRGCVRHIFTRCGFASGELQLTLVIAYPLRKHEKSLIEAVTAACPELKSLVLCLNKTQGNTVLRGEFRTVWGKDTISDRLCGLEFELSPLSFYQINPVQAEKLYMRALEYASPDGLGTVLDLYCGAGTISLCLARGAKHVIGAEIVPEAVENARRNAVRNGVDNVEFICGDAGQAAKQLEAAGIRPDAIVVDPPRKGLSPDVIEAAAAMSPERIVYVSCDPGTLARDMRLFAEKGWLPAAGTAVDMFPGTHHIETVCLLSKLQSKEHIEIEVKMDEMDLTSAESKATYDEIKAYVLEKHDLKVSSLYISQIKRKCGLAVGQNYNLSKKENAEVPQCPLEKESAIINALRYFQMI